MISLSGSGGVDLATLLAAEIKAGKPKAIGLASAYVSVFGVRELIPLFAKVQGAECRLVAGIDGEVTHPTALQEAKDAGWNVRIANREQPIYPTGCEAL